MDPRSLTPRLPVATSRVLALTSRGPIARAASKVLVAGESVDDAIRVTGEVVVGGQRVSWMPLLTHAASPDDIITARQETIGALNWLAAAGTEAPDLTLDVATFGVLAPDVTPGILLNALREVGQAARNAGVTLTLTIPDAALIEAVHVLGHELRQDFPEVGIVLPTRLRRLPTEVSDLAREGQRVRLSTGRLDAAIGLTSARESGAAFVDITKQLLAGGAQVSFDTDDALLLDIVGSLVQRYGAEGAEVIAPLGTQSARQREIDTLATRVLVPYGPRWAEYVANLVAARPSLALSLPNPIRRKG